MTKRSKKSPKRRADGSDHPGGGWLLVWLAVALAHLVLLATRLANAPSLPWGQLQAFGGFTAGMLLLWLYLRFQPGRTDGRIIIMACFLMGLGLAIQFRMGVFAGSGGRGVVLAVPLGMAALLGVLVLTSRGRYRHLAAAGWVGYVGSVALLAAMLAFGRRYRGGVYLPGNLNPSEIVKPLLVLFLAAFLSGRKADFSETQIGLPLPPARTLVRFALLWALPMGLVILLRDLGLLLLLNTVLVIMLYAVARKPGYLFIGGLGVLLSGLIVGAISAHARARFDVWLNPFADATGKGWQILQGLSALYAGGLWGAGIGAGAPQAVPIVSSDFIYAALAEELGIIACVLLVLVFAMFALRGWAIAAQAKGPFGMLLGVGLTATLTVQALLNVGGVVKAIPMTGIPLPFISQGGSSLIAALIMVGLLAAISDGRKGGA
jgi:cell division protein FtsW (lipid II flippase)